MVASSWPSRLLRVALMDLCSCGSRCRVARRSGGGVRRIVSSGQYS
ncbi:hypothetical protein CSC44_2647 [Pseudomonas aeruginosa]|nr:hypothetical protein CSC44_2647 [Pseudomonas aeruginosa]